MEKNKSIDEVELKELIEKILCKRLGFCAVEPETDKIPNSCISVLKVGETYIQWSPEKHAYRVWAKDGTFIGVAKNKDGTCKNLSEWSDGKYYGIR